MRLLGYIFFRDHRQVREWESQRNIFHIRVFTDLRVRPRRVAPSSFSEANTATRNIRFEGYFGKVLTRSSLRRRPEVDSRIHKSRLDGKSVWCTCLLLAMMAAIISIFFSSSGDPAKPHRSLYTAHLGELTPVLFPCSQKVLSATATGRREDRTRSARAFVMFLRTFVWFHVMALSFIWAHGFCPGPSPLFAPSWR